MTYENYLIHSDDLRHAFWMKKKPKYFKKDKGRYFYSEKEWNAYVRNKNSGKKVSDLTKKEAGIEISNRESYNTDLYNKLRRLEGDTFREKLDRYDADREIAYLTSERRRNYKRLKDLYENYDTAKENPWYDRLSEKLERASWAMEDSLKKVVNLSRKNIEKAKNRVEDIISKGAHKIREVSDKINLGFYIADKFWQVAFMDPKRIKRSQKEYERANLEYEYDLREGERPLRRSDADDRFKTNAIERAYWHNTHDKSVADYNRKELERAIKAYRKKYN